MTSFPFVFTLFSNKSYKTGLKVMVITSVNKLHQNINKLYKNLKSYVNIHLLALTKF